MAGVNLVPIKDYGATITPWQERHNMLLECENRIRKDLAAVQESFLYIGYSLMDINRMGLYSTVYYQNGGDYCKNIYQYALQELDMSKTTVYNLMSVAETFFEAQTGLKPEYKDYSFSQLVELLSFTEEQRKYALPQMSVRSLRSLLRGESVHFSDEKGSVHHVKLPKELIAIPDVGNESVSNENLIAESSTVSIVESECIPDVGNETDNVIVAESAIVDEPKENAKTVYIQCDNIQDVRDWFISLKADQVFPLTISYSAKGGEK